LISDECGIGLLDKSSIPVIPSSIISDSFEDFEYWYNTRGESGVVVLQGMAAKLLPFCDNHMSIGQIQSLGIWTPEEKVVLPQLVWSLAKIQMIELPKVSKLLAADRQEKHRKKFTVWIQLTDQCNLRCPYCYIDKSPHRIESSLVKQSIEKILREIEEDGYTDLVIKYAGGEPTLCWDIINEVIDWTSSLQDCSVKIRHVLLTNGYSLSEDMLHAIGERKMSVSISLDGIGAVHDRQRATIGGDGSFLEIHKNISSLIELGVKPYILTTVTRNNQDQLQELAQYCTERGLGFRLSLYRGTGENRQNFEGDHEKLASDLVDFYEWFGNHLPEKNLHTNHRFCDVNLLRPKATNCGIGKSSVAIDTSGKLAICQYQMDRTIGDIRNDGVLDSLNRQNFYNPSKDNAKFVPECKSCQWLYTCANGCPLHLRSIRGTFTSVSSYCSVYSAVLPALIRTHAKQIVNHCNKEGR